MTLDEAIIHAKELSENQSICKDCREEHKQLAAWLEELKQYKEKNQPEKTAEEMFKELGFEQIRNDGNFIKYKKADNGIDKIITFSIMFRYFDSKYGDYPFTAPYEFDIDTLKAVNKQVEELGWI